MKRKSTPTAPKLNAQMPGQSTRDVNLTKKGEPRLSASTGRIERPVLPPKAKGNSR